MLESKHERDLRNAVVEAGGLCIKLPAALYRGIPDRLILLPGGKVFFVELKKDRASVKASTRIHQDRFREILLNLGLNYRKIEGPSQTQEFIDEHIRPTKRRPSKG